jgi:hypothetical protein
VSEILDVRNTFAPVFRSTSKPPSASTATKPKGQATPALTGEIAPLRVPRNTG